MAPKRPFEEVSGDSEIVDLTGLNEDDCEFVRSRPAPPSKVVCIICEDEVWSIHMIQCPKCDQFYHEQCAFESCDENVCLACDLTDLIDDEETSDQEDVSSMFNVLRQSKHDTESNDGDVDAVEDEGDEDVDEPSVISSLKNAITPATIRWKNFLENATVKLDEKFKETTTLIIEELQDDETKSIYSTGFA